MNPQHTGVFLLPRVAWIDDSSIAEGLSDNTDKGILCDSPSISKWIMCLLGEISRRYSS